MREPLPSFFGPASFTKHPFTAPRGTHRRHKKRMNASIETLDAPEKRGQAQQRPSSTDRRLYPRLLPKQQNIAKRETSKNCRKFKHTRYEKSRKPGGPKRRGKQRREPIATSRLRHFSLSPPFFPSCTDQTPSPHTRDFRGSSMSTRHRPEKSVPYPLPCTSPNPPLLDKSKNNFQTNTSPSSRPAATNGGICIGIDRLLF